MGARKDAGLALARFCVAIDERFPALSGPRTVWTTGRITLDPGALSIIPGAAEMLFQIRDDDPAVIARLELGSGRWRVKPPRAARAASRWTAFARAPLP